MGETDRGGKGFVLMGRAMLSKSLIQFSVDGWSCVPSLLFPWVQTMGKTSTMVALMVKHMPAMRETQVRSLGWEDPLEEEMATHSSTLAWRIPWTEEPDGLQPTGFQRVGLSDFTFK